MLRVAAGLPPGPPDDDDAVHAPGGNGEERGYGPQPSRYSVGAPGREHHSGQHEAQRRRVREPQGYTEEMPGQADVTVVRKRGIEEVGADRAVDMGKGVWGVMW